MTSAYEEINKAIRAKSLFLKNIAEQKAPIVKQKILDYLQTNPELIIKSINESKCDQAVIITNIDSEHLLNISIPDLLKLEHELSEITGFTMTTKQISIYRYIAIVIELFWEFWKQFTSYKRVLIIQDDGVIVRPGIEKQLHYDYVGPPWIHSEVNKEIILMNKGLLVGNGGLSIRNPRVMYDICHKFAKEGQRLFNNQLQPIPEDVFLSARELFD